MMMIRSRVNGNNLASSSRITTPNIGGENNNNNNRNDDNDIIIIEDDGDTSLIRGEQKKKKKSTTNDSNVSLGFDWLRQQLKRQQRGQQRKQTMTISCFGFCCCCCCCLIIFLTKNSRRLATNDSSSTTTTRIPIVPPGRENLKPILNIIQGKSRYDVDNVVFAMSKGYNTQIEMYYTLIGTLLQTGYNGDIVLGMDPIHKWSIEIRNYLSQIPNLIIYDVSKGCKSKVKSQNVATTTNPYDKNSWDDIICTMDGYYQDIAKTGKLIKDTVVGKSLRKFRYEHYWIWSQQYSPTTKILIVDSRDTYFQLNPFMSSSSFLPLTTHYFLYFFEERPENTLDTKETAKWIKKLYGQRFSSKFLLKYGNKTTLCSGTTIGSQYLIEKYLIYMIIELNNSIRPEYPSGDQAHHNVLYYDDEKNKLFKQQLNKDDSNNNNDNRNIDIDIKSFHNYDGIVATIGGKPYSGLNLIEQTQKQNNGEGETDTTTSSSSSSSSSIAVVLDNKGNTIPIVHQFDRHPTLIVTNLVQVDQMRNKQKQKQTNK